jgi:putative transposase
LKNITNTYHPEFLTATILKWKHLLTPDTYKKIITDSLEWLVRNNRCKVNGFVIMPKHIHLLWKISDDFEREQVQGALFYFSAHEFKKKLKDNPLLLGEYRVTDTDRTYQFWGRNPLAKECFSGKFFFYKNWIIFISILASHTGIWPIFRRTITGLLQHFTNYNESTFPG